MKETLMTLLKNPVLWTAITGLVNAIIAAFFPTFPKEVLVALNAVIAAIAAIFTGNSVVQTVRAKSK